MTPSRRALVLTIGSALALSAGEYRSKGFIAWPASAKIAEISSVAVGTNGHLYVLQRGEPPMLEFDEKGDYLRGWGSGMFKTAHGIRVDRQGRVWTTDNGNHVLRSFSPDGKLLKTFGQVDVAGKGKDGFRSPDDLVFSSKGEIFVADSGNSRIVHLAADGSYLSEWGSKGTEPGQFGTPHGLAIDANDRIYVADRGNKRVQVFSPAGKLIGVWSGFGNPFGLLLVGKQLYVSAGESHEVYQVGMDGRIEQKWGDPAMLKLPHFMTMSRKGDLLIAEIEGKRVQVFSTHD